MECKIRIEQETNLRMIAVQQQLRLFFPNEIPLTRDVVLNILIDHWQKGSPPDGKWMRELPLAYPKKEPPRWPG